MYRRLVAGRRLLSAFLLLIALWAPPSVTCAQAPSPIQRFGVDMTREYGDLTDYDIARLHIALYADWGVNAAAPVPGGIEYVPVIRVRNGVPSPSLSELGPLVDANLGRLWIVGNEPENIWQDNCTPAMYAAVYHDVYTMIKDRDSTAQVAVGGVTQPTPLRLQWLDAVLQQYLDSYGEPMPVDVWTIHTMILQELKGSWGCEIPRGLAATSGRLYTVAENDSIRIFRQHIVDMRVWMRDRGYRNTPLINSEYGVLMPVEYGFTAERVNAFMNASFDYMLTARDDDLGYPADGNRLVQRWLWNSLNDQPYNPATGRGFNGALFDYQTRQITAVGLNYAAYTSDLLAGQVCLTGAIDLAGRSTRPHTSYVITGTVTLYPAGGGSQRHTIETDATGHFGLCRLAPGTYDIVVQGANTLARRLDGVQLSAESPVIDFGLLTPGDANGDNCIDILDYSTLATAYGWRAGDTGYEASSDFNGDGRVDILDYSLLATHYSECGAQ